MTHVQTQLDRSFDPGETGSFSVSQEILTGGVSTGVQRLVVETSNGLTAVILPTRGMSIEYVRFESLRFGWESPICEPVHPMYVPSAQPDGLGWLDGFNELFVRCGLTSNGAPQFNEDGRLVYGLHGRIANLPAHSLEIRLAERGILEVSAAVDEIRFHFDKWRLRTTYRFFEDAPRIEIVDQVENLAGTERDFQLLYHYNLGRPLLGAGAKIHVPLRRIVPRNENALAHLDRWSTISEPISGAEEQVYFCEPLADSRGRCPAVLENSRGDSAATIEFSPAELTWFSLWKNTIAEADGYVIGFEPATNFPNPRRFEQQHGRTVKLAAGQVREFHLGLQFATNPQSVVELNELCASIQGNTQPEIVRAFDSSWCAPT